MTQAGHRVITASELAPPVGYAHAIAAAPGRVVFLGGMTAQRQDGTITGETMVEQFELSVRNLNVALRAAGGRPDHLVSLQIFVTDVEAYRTSLRPLGHVWRSQFGRHYPAMAVIGVRELLDPAAKVELMGIAVVP
ncbi:MAG: RidA family protein [Chloroflexi bacterium]|nr:MAG: RidA family protein [Chloroflexota bacterium]TMF17253.1 MAG: RidA family protein [Chloroflexota bacterium]